MNAKEIKSFILEDVEGRLFPILEEFNYHKIKNHGRYVACAVEGYNNANGFIVKLNPSLTCTGYTTNSGFESGDNLVLSTLTCFKCSVNMFLLGVSFI